MQFQERNNAQTSILWGIPQSAMCVQKLMIHFCNSQEISRFAAFFIDTRTKRSIVKSFNYFCFDYSIFVCCGKFTNIFNS